MENKLWNVIKAQVNQLFNYSQVEWFIYHVKCTKHIHEIWSHCYIDMQWNFVIKLYAKHEFVNKTYHKYRRVQQIQSFC